MELEQNMNFQIKLSLIAALLMGATLPAYAQSDAEEQPAEAEATAAESGEDTHAEAEAAAPVVATDADLDQVVATIDGNDVLLGEVLTVKATIPPQYLAGSDDENMQTVLNQIAVQRRLADIAPETKVLDFQVENVELSTKANATIETYADENLTDEYLQATYDEVIGDQPDQTEWNASHILVASEDEAKAAKERIDGGEDFAAVAMELSSDGSAAKGGELGWFGPGQMVPEFENAVKGLEKDQVSDPVESQFGWHIVKLNDTRIAEKPTFEEVEPQLRDFARSRLIDQYISEETAKAEIEKIEGVNSDVFEMVLPE